MTPLHYSVLNAFENSGNVLFHTASSKNIFVPSFTEDTFIWGSEGDVTVAHDSHILGRVVPLSFQCLELLEVIKTAGAPNSYVNKVASRGRTALHLAAKNGEECCVLMLLQNGARTDLTDHRDRTPLDVAVEFAPNEFHSYNILRDEGNPKMQCGNAKDSFDLIRA